jgi:hypothetical protein
MYPGGEQRRASFSDFSKEFSKQKQPNSPQATNRVLSSSWTHSSGQRNSVPNGATSATSPLIIPEVRRHLSPVPSEHVILIEARLAYCALSMRQMATGQPLSPPPTTKLFKSPSCPPAPLSPSNQQCTDFLLGKLYLPGSYLV